MNYLLAKKVLNDLSKMVYHSSETWIDGKRVVMNAHDLAQYLKESGYNRISIYEYRKWRIFKNGDEVL